LKVAVELEQAGGRQPRVIVVHLRSSICSWSGRPNIGDAADIFGAGRGRVGGGIRHLSCSMECQRSQGIALTA
jgi:hypothetical protein